MPSFHRSLFITAHLLLAGVASSQTTAARDDDWRQQKLWTASKLIAKGDFSPITEAFNDRDLDLLWSYYRGSDYLLYHTFKPVTSEMIAAATEEQKKRYLLMQEREKLAASYLLQIPKHARHVGDWIERSLTQKNLSSGRDLRISAMGQLGSDEVMVELGRFLFDDRNPDVTGPVPPLTLGVPLTTKYQAAGYLIGALRNKPGIAAEIKAAAPSAPGWFERTQNWWLKSEEAAPYRRKLADAGYMLPPGYPPMEELRGARSTIAGGGHKRTDVQGWWFLILLPAFLVVTAWLALRKRLKATSSPEHASRLPPA